MVSEPPREDAPTEMTGPKPDDPDTQPTEFADSAGVSSSSAHRPHAYRLAPGQRFGRYEIIRAIGSGGMGEVYEAVQSESGHRLALKLISGDSGWIESQRKRFLREGQLAASINHPHSLYVYGTEEIDGIPVIAMELAPGGTLKSRVEQEGPLPPNEAVRSVLQIIEGLQAAESVGVLHRDIKPANCFLDRDESIKIGDYGLAISMLGSEATQLTATGTILGTPAFASPEQLRADELDVRSDIYSVGATLFYLLTGGCPFAGVTGLKLMSQILEKKPFFPKKMAASIPQDLIRVVLRCLEKKRSDRFQGYPELTKQLEKFQIAPPQPVPLLRRFAAGFIDYLILPALIMTYVLGRGGREATSGLTDVGLFGIMIFYSGLTEGLWGATLGKAMAGIRVRRPSGTPADLKRAFLRGLIFWSPSILVDLVRFALVAFGAFGFRHPVGIGLDALSDYAFLLVFLPARQRNGWKGAHELLSRTFTARKPAVAARPDIGLDSEIAAAAEKEVQVGPYLVPSSWGNMSPGQVVLGMDPTLRRRVWIQACLPETPPVSESRRNLSRKGRLRWLNGRRSPLDSWDSYEAVDGKPFLDVVNKPHPWELVRHWLIDLGEEVLGEQDESDRVVLQLDRIWVTADGRLLLLDFPAPAPSGTAPHPPHTGDVNRAFAEPTSFLHHVASMALTGLGSEKSLTVSSSSGVPLPIHTRQLLERLSKEEPADSGKWLPQMRNVLQKRTDIGRRRRAWQMTLSSSPAILIACVLVASSIAIQNALRSQTPNFRPFKKCLAALQEIDRSESTPTSETEAKRAALEVYLAGPLRDGLPNASTKVAGWQVGTYLLDKEERELAERILAAHPHPSVQEIAEARETLGSQLDEFHQSDSSVKRRLKYLWLGAVIFAEVLVFLSPLLLILAFVFRGGLGYSILEMAVVSSSGNRVSRWRCLVRSAICWLPFFAIWIVLVVFFIMAGHHGPDAALDLGARIGHTLRSAQGTGIPQVGFALFLLGIIWAIVKPQRSLPDVVTRTYLIPE